MSRAGIERDRGIDRQTDIQTERACYVRTRRPLVSSGSRERDPGSRGCVGSSGGVAVRDGVTEYTAASSRVLPLSTGATSNTEGAKTLEIGARSGFSDFAR